MLLSSANGRRNSPTVELCHRSWEVLSEGEGGGEKGRWSEALSPLLPWSAWEWGPCSPFPALLGAPISVGKMWAAFRAELHTSEIEGQRRVFSFGAPPETWLRFMGSRRVGHDWATELTEEIGVSSRPAGSPFVEHRPHCSFIYNYISIFGYVPEYFPLTFTSNLNYLHITDEEVSSVS